MVEWPPSPWRLARAMVAAYHISNPQPPRNVALSLLKKVAYNLPRYNLPRTTMGHTRHYMPGIKMEILDAFLHVHRPIFVVWPDVDLDPNENTLLTDSILPNLRYLGRAESPCLADAADPPHPPNCIPLGSDPAGGNLTNTLAPRPGCDIFSDSVDSLSVRTADLHKIQRINPPAGRWVRYVHLADAPAPSHKTASGAPRRIEVMRFALTGNPQPNVRHALRVADAARHAVTKLSVPSQTPSGHDADSQPARGHDHASFLPTAERNPERIDHLTVVARAGFADAERNALLGMKKLYAYKVPHMQVVFESAGVLKDFSHVRIFGRSRVWRTLTPVIFARHQKRRGGGRIVDSWESQIMGEIKSRYGYDVKRVKMLRTVGRHRPLEFSRAHAHDQSGRQVFGVMIEFKGEISGPLTLGYASHSGMGLFAPEVDGRD